MTANYPFSTNTYSQHTTLSASPSTSTVTTNREIGVILGNKKVNEFWISDAGLKTSLNNGNNLFVKFANFISI